MRSLQYFLLLGGWLTLATPSPLQAQPDPSQLVSPLAMKQCPDTVLNSSSLSTTELTVPSLWWNRLQSIAYTRYDGKLIEDWFTCPLEGDQVGTIDILVNRQVWSLMDYLDRYAFLHDYGTAAREFGYNIRVIDNRDVIYGGYACDFADVDLASLRFLLADLGEESDQELFMVEQTQQLSCAIDLDSSGRSSIRGRTTSPAASPTGSGTD